MANPRIQYNRSLDGMWQGWERSVWDKELPLLTVVTLHPQFTYRGNRVGCERRAAELGCGGVLLTYLYQRRADHFSRLVELGLEDPPPAEIEPLETVLAQDPGPVLVAWGHGAMSVEGGNPVSWGQGRGADRIARFAIAMIDYPDRPVLCAGLDHGQPRSPIMPGFHSAELVPWQYQPPT